MDSVVAMANLHNNFKTTNLVNSLVVVLDPQVWEMDSSYSLTFKAKVKRQSKTKYCQVIKIITTIILDLR